MVSYQWRCGTPAAGGRGGGGGGGGGQIYIKAPLPKNTLFTYMYTCPSIAANHVNHQVYI